MGTIYVHAIWRSLHSLITKKGDVKCDDKYPKSMWGTQTTDKWKWNIRYTIIHEGLSFFFFSFGLLGELSGSFVARKHLIKCVKTLSTLSAVFAEASMKSHPSRRAMLNPSSRDTWRSFLSTMLPTSMNIGLCRFARIMAEWNVSRRSNVWRDATEYTKMKPWPSLF